MLTTVKPSLVSDFVDPFPKLHGGSTMLSATAVIFVPSLPGTSPAVCSTDPAGAVGSIIGHHTQTGSTCPQNVIICFS